MLLSVDIGNTNIKFGVFKEDELICSLRIATDIKKTADEYAVDLFTLFRINQIDRKDIKASIISSVVPKTTPFIVKAIKQVLNIDSLIVGPGIKTGLNILLDDPAQLGSDLVCACVSAIKNYSSPAIVISMGTATAICIIDENSAMRGGIIAPGVQISLDALTQRGALLASVGLDAPKSIIGKNTNDCVKSGVVIGEACKIDGIIDKIEKELGTKCTVIATGGLSHSIIPNCSHEITIDDNLIIKGLKIIYDKNN